MQLIRYQTVIDEYTTHWLDEPYDADGERLVEDLGELGDGYRYVIVPDEVTLPAQKVVTAEDVPVTSRVRQRIAAESKHARLLAERAQKRPSIRYTDRDLDRLELLRDVSGAADEYVREAREKSGDMRRVSVKPIDEGRLRR